MAYDKDGNETQLTQGQIDEYVSEDCIRCPICQGENIMGEKIDPDGSMCAYRNVNCGDCGSSWTERFEVESIA